MSGKRTRCAVLAAVAATALSGCGLSSGSALPLDVGPGTIQPLPGLEDVTLTVGSKDFTENWILGYIAEFALAAAGAEIRDLTNIQGSNSAREALEAGQIDLQWEYTGTSWISYNGFTDPIPDAMEQFEAVREVDRERHGIEWIAMSPVDNTYAFALNQANHARLGVDTLSEMAELVNADPAEGTFCVETEFASRNDGMPGVEATYGFTAVPGNIHTLGTGPIYQATADGTTCNFGEIFSTDGRVKGLDLVVLEDDLSFFPRYNAAVTVRTDTLADHPEIEEVLTPVAEALNNEIMADLNARVDVDGADPDQVALDWLVSEGFVSPG
ncbi:glycine/betaine ABC transporter substrate-binding protein [Actinoalloteichus sp. AHMU CJ021]|uniref:Osmoprotectant transport system substrate-binding protein n=1 Tax=Actinoalloteichus caeruleus DSM 43889 TaxID=1120930 RepID=A0ABT1JK75_ACTCY|nr:glycine betaine ABC transporter substrate-binding protein [Actinoalloteichus caeruleus]AUS78759.1 glycine/betaine ABC transporter substrate-binding protein [Actinoalloteichus sp. AHMU CJ021]MCP2332920.1 osmoprotectant transport system substrate-binding protein [Actinoalloteichus caeruleus DSM 43889]